jgi:hypothetical protein
VKSTQLKRVLAGAGATAVVAMGALGVIVSGQPARPGTIGEGPQMTLGETTTSTTPPTTIETSVAVPPVTATPPDGF